MPKLDREQLQKVNLKKILQYLIGEHNDRKMLKLQQYYEGDHDILRRTMADPIKPNNRLMHNLAEYITDTHTGYFMGKPISYSADLGSEEEPKDNKPYLTALQDIFDYNNEQDHNSELAKTASINGVAYELLYVDEEGRVRFVGLPPENVIYAEADDVSAEPVMAVREYAIHDIATDKKITYYDVYTENEIIAFRENDNEDQTGRKTFTEIRREEHYFEGVPVVKYENNREQRGDFENVVSLIDAYNIAQSDTANDFEYFTDAYLVLMGLSADEKDIRKMKENRVLTFDDKESGAEWLIKGVNDTAIENYKNRLWNNIHILSKTPDLEDEKFSGNMSGVAISFKMWPLEQAASNKERKFKRGLQRRIELITVILNKENNLEYDYRDISMTFSRNMPQNLLEIAQMVQGLKGIVSDVTLLNQLPFVEVPQEEMKRLEEQMEGLVDLDAGLEEDEGENGEVEIEEEAGMEVEE